MMNTHNCHHLARALANNQALFPDRNAPAKPIVAKFAQELPCAVEPYSSIVTVECDRCGGTGSNGGPREEYDPCDACGGTRTMQALRNWLGEAFQIENGQLDMNPQREHLRALRHYATQLLNALNTPLSFEINQDAA
jgi:hypothetical protein